MIEILKKIGLILLALAAAIVFFVGSLGLDVHWKGLGGRARDASRVPWLVRKRGSRRVYLTARAK